MFWIDVSKESVVKKSISASIGQSPKKKKKLIDVILMNDLVHHLRSVWKKCLWNIESQSYHLIRTDTPWCIAFCLANDHVLNSWNICTLLTRTACKARLCNELRHGNVLIKQCDNDSRLSFVKDYCFFFYDYLLSSFLTYRLGPSRKIPSRTDQAMCV